MIISRYFVYFVIYGCMGWVYETIFCTIKGRKWENRGFLYGPICPIYGIGASIMTGLLEFVDIEYTWWQIFLIASLGSIVLEYVTSWVLEKLFHAYWWDYSDVPLNINGRVCIPCAVGFGLAGILVIEVIAPFTQRLVTPIPPLVLEGISLVFMAVVAMDVTLTVCALTNFERTVATAEDALNTHMDQIVANVQEKTQNSGAWITEERARFSRESIENSIRSMGWMYRRALVRVKGYRSTKKQDKHRMQNMLDSVKKYVARRK